MKAAICAHCGKRVLRSNGFFRSWPDPIALHHDCVHLYREAVVPGYGSSIDNTPDESDKQLMEMEC